MALKFVWNSENALDYWLTNKEPGMRKRDNPSEQWGLDQDLALDTLFADGVIKGENFDADVAETAMRLEFRASFVKDKMRDIWEGRFGMPHVTEMQEKVPATVEEQLAAFQDMLLLNNSAAATATDKANEALLGVQMIGESLKGEPDGGTSKLARAINAIHGATCGPVPVTLTKLPNQDVMPPMVQPDGSVVICLNHSISIAPQNGITKATTGWGISVPDGYSLVATTHPDVVSTYRVAMLEGPILRIGSSLEELAFTLVNHTNGISAQTCTISGGQPIAILHLVRTQSINLQVAGVAPQA